VLEDAGQWKTNNGVDYAFQIYQNNAPLAV
jgi:hypothetical protein